MSISRTTLISRVNVFDYSSSLVSSTILEDWHATLNYAVNDISNIILIAT